MIKVFMASNLLNGCMHVSSRISSTHFLCAYVSCNSFLSFNVPNKSLTKFSRLQENKNDGI